MRIKIILLAITIVSITSSVFANSDNKINLALIADKASGLENSPLVSLLEVELSKLENVKLLERNEIEKILAEKKLQLSFEVKENESRKQIGTILGTDVLLFVKMIRNQEQKESINVRFVETRTGIVLDNLLQNSSNINEDIQGLIKDIKQGLLKVSVPLYQRHYLGISDIRNEEPGRELNPIALALTQLLKHDLNSSKYIVVLEREQLNHILNERNLAGVDVQLKASTILLEGGIRRNGNTKEYLVSLKLIEPSGGKSKNVSLTVPSSDMTIIRQEICKAIISALGDTSDFNISGDSHKEAAYFLKRAESYCTELSVLDMTDNRAMLISYAETALALDENNLDLRNRVFHCFRHIAWSHKTFSEIDHLKIQKRAHEIDLGTVESYARLGTQSIPNLTFDYLFQVYSYSDTAPLQTNEKEIFELQSEIHAICEKKFDILYKLFQTENKSPILLLTKRTRDSYDMYDTPDEFSQNLKSFVLENEKYQSIKSITFYEILADSLGCYREHNKEILPLLEWLRNRPDPTLKMLSYYALVHPEIDNDEAAIKVCDLLFFNDAQNVGEAIWKAAIKLSMLGKLESYFENVLILAENNKNFNILNNPELILEFMGRARKEKQIDWCRRIQPILDTYKIPSAQLNKFQRLQAALDRFLIEEESGKNNIGRWANYTITPISITDHDIIKDRYPEWVHIDNLNKKIAVVWRSLPQGNSLFNYIVTTMDIKGGSQKQLMKIESKNGFSVKCSENSSDCIFLGTPDKGLIMIGPDGFEIFGEAQGCPSNNILSMAYLNNYLYLGFYGSLARFDPKNKTFDILVSYKAIQIKNDLDGGDLYWIGSMIADPKNNSLWFSVTADRSGIWKYNPTTGKLNLVVHPYSNRLFYNDNGDIVFTIQSRINLLNPQTSEIKLLQGYSWEVVGGLSGFEIGTHCVMIGKDIIQPSGKLFSDDGNIYNIGKSWRHLEPFGSGAIAVSYYETNLNLSLIQPKELITNDNK